MEDRYLQIDAEPKLDSPGLVLGFSGWMDGGEVSTGTVDYLVKKSGADEFARIRPDGFYIYNFPGPIELSAMFRPYTNIENGIIRSYEEPGNKFYCDQSKNLFLFDGKEPNLAWHEYAGSIISLCQRFAVRRILFVGSVAGLVPHTREPRFLCSVSDEKLVGELARHGMKFVQYAGPASFITYLTLLAGRNDIEMISLVAEIPAYVQGFNPRCIEAAVRCVGLLLGVHMDVDELREIGDDFERKLNEMVTQQPDLAEKIFKLEQAYDDDIFNTEMGDLKEWLQQKGLRVD